MELIYYSHNRYNNTAIIKKHTLQYYELTLVIDGTMRYTVSGDEVYLKPGDAVFLRSGDTRERDMIHERMDYVSYNFYLDDDCNLPKYIKGALTGEIQLLIAACDLLDGKVGSERLRYIGYIFESMLMLLKERSSREYSEITEKILDFISLNYNTKITLERIAEEIHFSAVYCDTVFKRETGKSIVNYLIDIRLEEAKTLLLNNEYSVKEVSKRVGYEDYNYFSRLFKQRNGYTPTNYRNSVLKNL